MTQWTLTDLTTAIAESMQHLTRLLAVAVLVLITVVIHLIINR